MKKKLILCVCAGFFCRIVMEAERVDLVEYFLNP